MTTFSGMDIDQPAPHEIMHPSSRRLFRYWEQIRGERSAPNRGDLDLRELKPLLPWLAILERSPLRPTYRFRLAGTAVCRMWTRELTGTEVLDGFGTLEREAIGRLLDGVVGHLQPCVARFKATSDLGEMLGIELLLLPVRPDNGNGVQALAAVLPFREPSWLGYEPIVRFELSSVKTIWTEPLPGDTHFTQRNRRRAQFHVIKGGIG